MAIITHSATLPNGLKVKYFQTSQPSFNLWMNIGVGGRDETPEYMGICHLLEHAMFKGSGKYQTSFELSRQFGKFGGEANGETDVESHQFEFTGDADRLLDFLPVFEDFFFSPQFSDLEKEKQVVLEESFTFVDADGHYEELTLEGIKSLFPRQTLANPLCGNEDTILNFQKADLVYWRSKHYTPENCLLLISSNQPFPIVLAALHKRMGQTWEYLDDPLPREKLIKQRGKLVPEKKTVNLLHSPEDQFSGSVVFALMKPTTQDYIHLAMLGEILDDDFSSKLQAKIREEGLVYDISLGFEPYSDTIVANIEWEVSEDKLMQVCKAIATELVGLAKGNISQQEFDYYRDRRLFKNKVCASNLETLLEHEIERSRLSYVVPIEDESKQIKTLTVEGVSHTMRRLLASPTSWSLRGNRAKRFKHRISEQQELVRS